MLLRLLVLITLLCTSFFNTLSQDNKIFKALFKEAESILLYLNEDEDALERFLQLEKMEPENAHIQFKIGICYLHIPGQKHKSVKHLEFASNHISPDYKSDFRERNAPVDALFYLGLAYHYDNQLDKAIEMYEAFLDKSDATDYYNIEFVRAQIKGCRLAMDLQQEPVDVAEEQLDEAINLYEENINPAISGNGKHLVYTGLDKGRYRIMFSGKINGTWSKPRDISNQLNSKGEGISSSLSADGNTLFVYMDDRGLGNLYVSRYEGNRWTKLEKLNANINTKYWESGCCISPDGKTLFFTSNRKGGYGRLDLYKSGLDANGEWGPAVNLGPGVNSAFSEESPYLSADGSLLFFSSQGHSSIGGFDHFYTRQAKNGEWGMPVNLGYPANTTDDDVYLAPVGPGDTLYHSHYSEQSDIKNAICMMVLRADEEVSEITLKGSVKLEGTDEMQENTLNVKIINVATGDTLQTIRADTATGEYEAILDPGQYEVLYESKGFEPQKQMLSIARKISAKRIQRDVNLVQKEVVEGTCLLFENIYFDFNSFTVNKKEEIKLNKIIALMTEYSELKFEVAGHADTVGSKAYNIRLSGQRAMSVARYLFDRDVSESRLITKSLGEIRAVSIPKDRQQNADNIRKYNRRVEIRILKGSEDQMLVKEVTVPEFLRGDHDLNYTVIVLKVPERVPPGFFDKYGVEELSYVREQQISDGYLYTLGGFPEKPPAVEMLGKLQKAGLGESAIVDQHELSDIVAADETGGDGFAGYFQKPEKIEEIPWYTIQIFALKSPPHPSAFRGRNDVLAFPCNDGYIRYCLGKYQGYSKALKDLPGIQEDWYKDAFIQELGRLEKGLPPEPQE